VIRPRPHLKYRLRGEGHRRGFTGPAQRRVDGTAALLPAALASGNIFVWTQVSRRALWGEDLRFPVGRSFEDMATVPRLLLRARCAWHVPQPWLMYRRRDDSITALMSAAKVADLSSSLRGARRELLERWPAAPTDVRFALAHQAARNFLAAQRHALRLPADEAQPLWPRLHADLEAAVGGDLPLLQSGYLKRGWWLRAWRLAHALRRSPMPR
jgi:hypothetical protein